MNHNNIKVVCHYPTTKEDTDRLIAQVFIKELLIPSLQKKYKDRAGEAYEIIRELAREELKNIK